MAFADSAIAWLVLILIVAAVVYVLLQWLLSILSPQKIKRIVETEELESDEEFSQRRRRNIVIFVVTLVTLGIIMAGGGVSALLNTQKNVE